MKNGKTIDPQILNLIECKLVGLAIEIDSILKNLESVVTVRVEPENPYPKIFGETEDLPSQ